MKRATLLVAISLIATACSADASDAPTSTAPPTTAVTTTTAPATTTTSDPYESCVRFDSSFPEEIDGDDLVEASIVLSEATFDCAPVVALVGDGDADSLMHAARFLDGSGPILAVDGALEPATIDEIERLGPREIVTFALEGVALDDLGDLPVDEAVPPEPGSSAVLPALGGDHLILAATDELAALAWTTGKAAGQDVEGVTGDLFDAHADLVSTVKAAETVTVLASPDSTLRWQAGVVRSRPELPGGGYRVFAGKRLVALYGNPTTPFLGVLGEQGPAEGLERLQTIADGYEADGFTVVPTFEIIVTVASARAGADNDYSDEMSVDTLRPWVEFAADNDAYVLLDLQPGRTDFLTQAKYYEELLRLPHVGLALDPEWRLKPNQVHLRQIGSVDAAEINTVGEWLAGIVREENLPEKLFLVHQFKLSMITDRDLIELHPELAFVIQMDGQGPLPTKYETYRAITAGTEDTNWLWGWKNFFDEDSPTATPEQVLDVEPVVVFVSFQ